MAETKILVVEDEGVVAKDIETSLEIFGYTVSGIVSHGEEAVKEAVKTKPDLVLMDIRLKGRMDGIEATKKIRRRFDIPVVYLTSYADEETVKRAKVTKPFGYILKPIEAKELHTTIEIALYRHKMEKKLKESQQWMATILKSIGDAVIATDTNGLVTFMNPVAEILMKCRQKDALGRDLAELFNIRDEETLKIAENPVTKVLKTGREHSLINHTAHMIMDGRELPIDYSVAPIRNDGGNIIGVVLVFRDITERKQTEMEIKKKIEDLEKFYKVAVGRELKMIALKKKTKELERKISMLEERLREKHGGDGYR